MNTKVAVIGLWHQGIVVAACLADWGYDVLGADTNNATIENLNKAKAPLFEPGLDDLLSKCLSSGNLNRRRKISGQKAFCVNMATTAGSRRKVIS